MDFFGTGIIRGSLEVCNNCPLKRQVENVHAKTSESSTAKSGDGIFHGPGALGGLILLRDLCTLSLDNSSTLTPAGGVDLWLGVLFSFINEQRNYLSHLAKIHYITKSIRTPALTHTNYTHS